MIYEILTIIILFITISILTYVFFNSLKLTYNISTLNYNTIRTLMPYISPTNGDFIISNPNKSLYDQMQKQWTTIQEQEIPLVSIPPIQSVESNNYDTLCLTFAEYEYQFFVNIFQILFANKTQLQNDNSPQALLNYSFMKQVWYDIIDYFAVYNNFIKVVPMSFIQNYQVPPDLQQMFQTLMSNPDYQLKKTSFILFSIGLLNFYYSNMDLVKKCLSQSTYCYLPRS